MIVWKKIKTSDGLPARDLICDQCGHGNNIVGRTCEFLYCSIHDLQPERSKREDINILTYPVPEEVKKYL